MISDPELKVLGSVVRPHPVDMVDSLCPPEGTTEHSLHDQAVFPDPATFVTNDKIPFLVDVPLSLAPPNCTIRCTGTLPEIVMPLAEAFGVVVFITGRVGALSPPSPDLDPLTGSLSSDLVIVGLAIPSNLATFSASPETANGLFG